MSQELHDDMKAMFATHTKVVAAMAEMQAMRLKNDERRSKGQSDTYAAEAFWEVQKKLTAHSDELSS